jgi:hypothetical protein
MSDESGNMKFIGKGWSFPPVFNKYSGEIAMSQGNNDIRESLEILLCTRPGERFLKPEYGCDLSEMNYDNMTLGLRTRLTDRIRRSIVQFESRISMEDVNFESVKTEGIVYIHITYTIRSTNTRTNMVFPYYLDEGTDL